MSYFPHAFKQVYVGSNFATEGGTADLGGGGFGFFDPKTWQAIGPDDADVALHPGVIFVGGSYRDDFVGSRGGYKESLKSKLILPHHIHRFWMIEGSSAQPQIVYVGWDGSDDSTSPKFFCGENYSLRIDLKGSPAVRLLGHNFYGRFDVLTDCCVDAEDPEYVDPIVVLLEFAKYINADPTFSQFVTAEVVTTGDVVVDPATYTALTDVEDIEAAIGGLRLTVTYTDSSFLRCSYYLTDHIGSEPVYISSAQLVDESGNACPSFKQLTFTVDDEARGGTNTGLQIFRDWLLSDSYRQEFFHPSVRRRMVEGNNYVDMMDLEPLFDPEVIYNNYYVLYSVPRRSNPSGVYDNDQYLLQLSLPADSDFGDFETWMENYLESAGEGGDVEWYP